MGKNIPNKIYDFIINIRILTTLTPMKHDVKLISVSTKKISNYGNEK